MKALGVPLPPWAEVQAVWRMGVTFNMSSHYLAEGFECHEVIQPNTEVSSLQTSSLSERVPTPVPGAPPALAAQEPQNVWVSLHPQLSYPVRAQAVCFLGCCVGKTKQGKVVCLAWIFYLNFAGWHGRRCCWTTCWISLPRRKDCCFSNRPVPSTSASHTCSQDLPKSCR